MPEAIDIYLHELKITKIFGKLFGFDVWTEQFPKTPLTFLVPLDVLFYHLGQIYSAYYYRNDSFDLVLSLVTWNYGFQAVMAIKSVYSNRFMFWDINLSFIDIYKKYGEEEFVMSYTKKMQFLLRLLSLSITANVTSGCIYPIIDAVLIRRKKVLSFGFLLPFIDPVTDIGYFINFFWQMWHFILGGFGYAAIFRTFWLMIGQLVMKIEILKYKMNNLKVTIESNKDGNKEKQISSLLSEIVELHISYMEFINTLEEFGSKMLFVQAASTTAHISIILLVLTMKNDWYPGYFLSLVGTVVLMTICVTGTFVELKNESFCRAVYDTSWYLLSRSNQKKILFILMASQEKKSLTFLKMADVNVETFLEIYKRIYSAFMVLTNSN